jgi:beta-mannosidase
VSAHIRVEGQGSHALTEGWQAASTAPGLCHDTTRLDRLRWRPARVPGTAAASLLDAGVWRPGEDHDFDDEDWWFRTTFDAEPAGPGELVSLGLHGIATVAEVYLNGEKIAASRSMFARHTIDLAGRLKARNELAICCRALTPLLRERRRPRARWRTRLVSDGNLRFFRTMVLGRAPGFAPGPAPVGPWRPVEISRCQGLSVGRVTLRPRLEGDKGILAINGRLQTSTGTSTGATPPHVDVELEGPSGTHRAQLSSALLAGDTPNVSVEGQIVVRDVARWWPHTHGDPTLYRVRLHVRAPDLVVHVGAVGFRTLTFSASPDHSAEQQGLALQVNGVPVFARGAIWTPVDATSLAPSDAALREELTRVRDAGMNMLRIAGTSAYETAAFHDLCDELGILVWQDFMFANLDYPFAEPDFAATVEREIHTVLQDLGGRPSLTVVCGNSEVEQQVAMLSLDPELGRGEFFGGRLADILKDSGVDALYLPSTPCGGELPFRPNRGIANYYGVGGYRRPLTDARLAEVRFAAECLAFSNVPDRETLTRMFPDAGGTLAVHHPHWKRGVPRDNGAGWDFEDVRDHYLEQLFSVNVSELRRVDPERYLDLSRAVTGELMAEVFGEWRRRASPCRGGLVLWLRDLAPGAGWGVIDSSGQPKLAYYYLRRALAPIAVWTTDEGLGGVDVHIANDRPTTLRARLRVALYRDSEQRVQETQEPLELTPHSICRRGVEELLGKFVDASWAYRFGPPGHDLIVVSLERECSAGKKLISQAMQFPLSRPATISSAHRLGLRASACQLDDGTLRLSISARRLLYCVRLELPGFLVEDDGFSVEPGTERVMLLRARLPDTRFHEGFLSALNLTDRVRIDVGQLPDCETAKRR